MRKCLLTLLAAGAALCLPGAAQAATKSFFVDRGDILDAATGNAGGYDGVILSNGAVFFSLVLPGNYKSNTTVKARLLLSSFATGCSFNLATDVAIRSRTGVQTFWLYGPTSGFVPAVAGNTPAPNVSYVGFYKEFKLRPPTSGPYAGSQRAGDRITLAVQRDGAADSCNFDLFVEGVKVIYTTR